MSKTSTSSLVSRGISVLVNVILYLFLYVLPIVVAIDINPKPLFIQIWAFLGVIILSTIAGYTSKAWLEPIIAAALLTVVTAPILASILSLPPIVFAAIFLGLASFGTWLGTRFYRLRKHESVQ